MERIKSKTHPEQLIFSLLRVDDIRNTRTDLSPDEEYIQVSGRKMSAGFAVPPHRHTRLERNTDLTQEAWVILQGKVLATFYDLDDSFLCERVINPGDVVVFYRGGHALTVLEDDTIFYEFKSGPYFGLENDKVKIDG